MKRFVLLLTVAALSMGLVGTASAAVCTFDLVVEFSGATPPEGSTPWLRATFDDGGSAGSVTLTMEALNLVGTEYVQEWYFNFDPTLDLSALGFAYDAVGSDTEGASISTGVDAFQADGDGKFDIEFDFPQPNAQRFGAGETVVYDITSTDAIVAGSFKYFSASGGGKGPFRTAAHVGGIGTDGNDSGWVGDIPEPSSLMLLVGAGLVALGAGVRRKRA